MNQPLPPINPQPDLMNHIYFLKREWEHAMQVNTILGRDADQIQQLMHAQFQFLEHVVLDMSRQMRNLQDQLLVQQKNNQKMQNQLAMMEKQLSDSQKENIEHAKKLEYHQKLLENTLKETEQKLMSMDGKIHEHEKQIHNLLISVNGQDNRIQTILEKHGQLHDQIKEVGGCSQQTLKETDTLKEILNNEQKNLVQDRLSIQQSINQLQGQTSDRVGMIEVQLNSKLDKFQEWFDMIKNVMDKSKKERFQEQETIIAVLNTLKTSISNIRHEQKQFESKTLSSLQNTLALFKDQMSREVRLASKPIIVN